jgi:hypothetical protein
MTVQGKGVYSVVHIKSAYIQAGNFKILEREVIKRIFKTKDKQ